MFRDIQWWAPWRGIRKNSNDTSVLWQPVEKMILSGSNTVALKCTRWSCQEYFNRKNFLTISHHTSRSAGHQKRRDVWTVDKVRFGSDRVFYIPHVH